MTPRAAVILLLGGLSSAGWAQTHLVGSLTTRLDAAYGIKCIDKASVRDPQTARLVTFSWCYKKDTNSRNDRILYYFHGADGTARQYLDSAELRTSNLERGNTIPKPIVVQVSFGPRWVLSEVPSTTVPGSPRLLSLVADVIIPYLENVSELASSLASTTQSGVRRYAGVRYLMGESMGAYNVAQLANKRPLMFTKVVFGCPAFLTFNPRAPDAAYQQALYQSRTGSQTSAVSKAVDILAADYRSQEDWNTHDPLKLILQSPSHPDAFIWWNTADEFGFFEGAPLYKLSAKLRGIRTYDTTPSGYYSEANPGTHCAHDPVITSTIVNFLQ